MQRVTHYNVVEDLIILIIIYQSLYYACSTEETILQDFLVIPKRKEEMFSAKRLHVNKKCLYRSFLSKTFVSCGLNLWTFYMLLPVKCQITHYFNSINIYARRKSIESPIFFRSGDIYIRTAKMMPDTRIPKQISEH